MKTLELETDAGFQGRVGMRDHDDGNARRDTLEQRGVLRRREAQETGVSGGPVNNAQISR